MSGCVDCVFWEDGGICRRFPPGDAWGRTRGADWCGEWQPRDGNWPVAPWFGKSSMAPGGTPHNSNAGASALPDAPLPRGQQFMGACAGEDEREGQCETKEDVMIVCVECRREMRCERNGVGAEFGVGHVYMGDKYRCMECGLEVVVTAPVAVTDREHVMCSEYVRMA